MNFRQEYGDFSAQEVVDAILTILERDGIQIDQKSLTWTLVGVLFDKGVINRQEFEHVYYLIKTQKNGSHKFTESNS